MYYYQYDAMVQDGTRREVVTYLLKTSTPFKGRDIMECLDFQRRFLRTLVEFTEVVSEKLTYMTEPMAVKVMNNRGMAMESIPLVSFQEWRTDCSIDVKWRT